MENDYIILSDSEINEIMRFAGLALGAYERYLENSSKEDAQRKLESEMAGFYKDHIVAYRKIHELEKAEREKILKMAIDTGVCLEYSLPMIENYYKNGQLPYKTK